MLNVLRIISVIAAVAVLPDAAFARYGLADGGFDVQGSTVTSYCYMGSCPTGAWSGSGSGFAASGNIDWGGLTAPSPSVLAFLQADGTLSQTFTATETRRVVITWMEADRPIVGGQKYVVSVNGTPLGTYTSSVTNWTRRVSAPFDIVTGSTYTITFAGTSAGVDRSALLDSVDLAAAQSTISYTYDGLGRLKSTQTTGGVNDGLSTSYTLDAAGNRANVQTTGAP